VDPVGTIIIPALTWLLSGFLFGWAKPVPVVSANLRHPRRHMALVAAAGPMVNLLMALMWTALYKFTLIMGGQGLVLSFLSVMAIGGIAINLILMVLNLLPIPPLDGSRVLNGFLPEQYARQVDRFEQYGLLIVLLLLVTGVLGSILGPLLNLAQQVLLALFGLPNARLF
jgi:Zn-dependent protease